MGVKAGETETSDVVEYSADTIHHILRNRRRRAVLFYLKYRDPPVTMRELSTEIAAWEFDEETECISSSQRERVYVSLHQNHLPTLDEHGIIDYNQDRQIIRPDSGLDEFDPFIDPASTDEDVHQLVDERVQTVYAGIERGKLDDTLKNRVLRRLTPRINKNDRWSTYYLVTAGLGAGFILLASPLSPVQIPMTLAALTQTGLVAALAFIHSFVEANPDEVATAEEMFLGSLRPDWADSRTNGE